MKNKQKTKKSLTRRIKVTATGKIMHAATFKGHLRRHKSTVQRRRFRKEKESDRSFSNKVRKQLGVS